MGVCMFSSETYSLEDCYFYDSFTSDNSRFTLIQGTASMVYSDNGLKYTGTSNTDCIHKLNIDLPEGSYSLECNVTGASNSGSYSTSLAVEDSMLLQGSSSVGLYARKISTSGDFFNSHSPFNPPTLIKFEVTGTTSKTIKFYKDSTLLGQGTSITRNREFKFRSYNNRMIQIKDLKIKPL